MVGRIRREGTSTNDWTDAEHVKAQWEAWGQFTDPNPTNIVNPSMEEAVSKFKEHIAFKNLEHTTRLAFRAASRRGPVRKPAVRERRGCRPA